MDLTPPALTRSPASPANTYCPSERSLEYPSPILVSQHYRLTSLFPESCSLDSLDTDPSLSSLDDMTTSGWDSPSALATSSTSSPLPNILSADYDPFASYESPLPQQYGHESYPPPTSHSPAAVAHSPLSGADLAARSPAASAPRSGAGYSHSNPITQSLTPRVKIETVGDYGAAIEVSHYPSPASIPQYSAEGVSYSTNANGFLSDNQAAPWRQEYDAGRYFQNQPPASFSDARSPIRPGRLRRTSRKLTTKEEANFQCEVKGCGKLFSRSYNFKAHMETHDEKREYPFPCPIADCNKRFVRKTDLQRHHQSVHMKERNHKCDYCSRLFARKDTLRRHMEDGCSKRFDLGNLELRADYTGTQPTDRPTGGFALPPPGHLPPTAMPTPSGNSLLSPVVPSTRR